MSSSALLSIVSLLALSSAASSYASPPQTCAEALSRLLGTAERATPAKAPFSFWQFEGSDVPRVRATDFLPEDFVQEIESVVGPVHLTAKVNSRAQVELRVLTTEKNGDSFTILKADLWRDPSNPKQLIVEHLRIENPLPEGASDSLHLSQNRRGLPSTVFSHAKERLFEFARAGEFTSIGTGGAQNFLVLMLYMRGVGMRPQGEASEKMVAHLQSLYSYARKSLPEKYRPNAVNDFSRMIGDYTQSFVGPDSKAAWNTYSKSEKLRDGMTLLKSEDETVLGFIFDPIGANPNHTKVIFIDPETKMPIDFNGVVRSGRLKLSRPL